MTALPLVIGRRERVTIAAITLAFTLLLVTWACVTSVFSAPDEATHFDAVLHLALGMGWPAPGHMHVLEATRYAQIESTNPAAAGRPSIASLLAAHPGTSVIDQMSQHPPTWYALGAALFHVIGFEHRRWDVDLLALRLMDVVMMIPLPLLTWGAVRRVTRSPRVAVVAAVALFAVPQLASIGSSASNDVPVIVLGALAAYLVVRALTGDTTWRNVGLLALTLAGLAVTKGTGLPVIPFAALALLVAGRGVLTLLQRVVRAVVAVVVPALASGWWWLHNVVAYHALQPKGMPDVYPTRHWGNQASADVGYFLNTEWTRLTESFWGQFGALQYAMTPILTDTLSVVAAGAVVFCAFRRGPWRRIAVVMVLMPFFTLLGQFHDNWDSYDTTQVVSGAQGRYYFVALVPLIVLSAIAWCTIARSAEARDRVGRVALVAAPLIGAYGLTVAYRGFYENSHLQATFHGLALMANLTPVGKSGLVTVLVVTVLVWAAASVLAWRTVVTPRPRSRVRTGEQLQHV